MSHDNFRPGFAVTELSLLLVLEQSQIEDQEENEDEPQGQLLMQTKGTRLQIQFTR
jgi:hypothetical protein